MHRQRIQILLKAHLEMRMAHLQMPEAPVQEIMFNSAQDWLL